MSDIEVMPNASPNSAMPIGRPIAISDPKATSRMITAAIRPIISPPVVAGSSNAKNRSPLSSICNGEFGRASSATSFKLSRSVALRSSINRY